MSSFEEKVAKLRETDTYKLEKLKLELTEQICEKLQEAKMDRKDLAKKLGTSPAYITKLLSGETNFTVETLYKISKILKLNLDIRFVPSVRGSVTLTISEHSETAVDMEGKIVNRITGTTSKGNAMCVGVECAEISSAWNEIIVKNDTSVRYTVKRFIKTNIEDDSFPFFTETFSLDPKVKESIS